jgi:hypothetical protein
MSQVTFSIPDEILLALNATPDALASRLRLAASQLADYGVNTVDLSEEDLIHDLKSV